MDCGRRPRSNACVISNASQDGRLPRGLVELDARRLPLRVLGRAVRRGWRRALGRARVHHRHGADRGAVVRDGQRVARAGVGGTMARRRDDLRGRRRRRPRRRRGPVLRGGAHVGRRLVRRRVRAGFGRRRDDRRGVRRPGRRDGGRLATERHKQRRLRPKRPAARPGALPGRDVRTERPVPRVHRRRGVRGAGPRIRDAARQGKLLAAHALLRDALPVRVPRRVRGGRLHGRSYRSGVPRLRRGLPLRHDAVPLRRARRPSGARSSRRRRPRSRVPLKTTPAYADAAKIIENAGAPAVRAASIYCSSWARSSSSAASRPPVS